MMSPPNNRGPRGLTPVTRPAAAAPEFFHPMPERYCPQCGRRHFDNLSLCSSYRKAGRRPGK